MRGGLLGQLQRTDPFHSERSVSFQMGKNHGSTLSNIRSVSTRCNIPSRVMFIYIDDAMRHPAITDQPDSIGFVFGFIS